MDKPKRLLNPLTVNGIPFYPITKSNRIIMPNGNRWDVSASNGIQSVNNVSKDENGNITLSPSDVENGIPKSSKESIAKKEGVARRILIIPASSIALTKGDTIQLRNRVDKCLFLSGNMAGSVLHTSKIENEGNMSTIYLQTSIMIPASEAYYLWEAALRVNNLTLTATVRYIYRFYERNHGDETLTEQSTRIGPIYGTVVA